MVLDSGLYQNKYRVATTRLQNWDYTSSAYYFITVCSFEKYCYFGEILNGKVMLSSIGKMIKKTWLEVPNHFKNVVLDEFVVMPNHLHGIIYLNICRDVRSNVSTKRAVSTENFYSEISPKRSSLSIIVRLFKSSSNLACKKIDLFFYWQPRFYEHIIRNEKELNNIREYIRKNPMNWSKDEENPANIHT